MGECYFPPPDKNRSDHDLLKEVSHDLNSPDTETALRLENLLTQQLTSDNPTEVEQALSSTQTLLTWQSDIYHRKFAIAANVTNKNLGRLVEIVDGEDREQALQAASVIYRSWVGGQEKTSEGYEALKSLLPRIIADYPTKKDDEAGTFTPLAQEFVEDFCGEYTNRRASRLLDSDVLTAFGCHYTTKSMKEAWKDGTKASRFKRSVARSMQVMAQAESMQPGIVNDLQSMNLLRNVHRLTPKVLYIMHKEQIEHPDRNYLQWTMATYDHNDAFNTPELYERLQARLRKMGISLRISECGRPSEFEWIAMKALDDYAAHGAQIVSEVIAGHGSSRSIRLSQLSHLLPGHFYEAHHNRIGDAFTQDAETQLYSCSTGKEKDGRSSIARELAVAMGRTVLAPTSVVYTEKEIRPIRKGNGLNLQFDYKRRKGTKKGKKHFVPSKPAFYHGKTAKLLEDLGEDLTHEIPSENAFLTLELVSEKHKL